MEIIKSKDNPLVKKTLSLMENKRDRIKNNEFVIEGLRICNDAVINGAEITAVLMTEEFTEKHSECANLLTNSCNNVKLISKDICKKLCDTVTSQGVFCVCKIPDNKKISLGGKFIALENLQDPGNIGTVIRTAEAFGLDGVCLIGNCVDIYSPKVLRSTMGTIFSMPIYFFFDANEAKKDFIKYNIKSYGAVLDIGAKELSKHKLEDNCVCLIGNEANGLSNSAKNICDEFIYIEMSGNAESLNAAVAASVIMWEMTK